MHQEFEKKSKNGDEVSKMSNTQRVSKYKKKEEYFKLDFSGINFPMSPMEIKLFEKKNDISVNLYMINESESGKKNKCCSSELHKKTRKTCKFIVITKY